jgi:hypothetical protein
MITHDNQDIDINITDLASTFGSILMESKSIKAFPKEDSHKGINVLSYIRGLSGSVYYRHET